MMSKRKIVLVREILAASYVYGLEEWDPTPGSSGGVRYLPGMFGEVINETSPVRGRIFVALRMEGERGSREIHVRPESIADACASCGKRAASAGSSNCTYCDAMARS
jgi:hypothetical protein